MATTAILAINDEAIATARYSPVALASMDAGADDPRLDELVEILGKGLRQVTRCPCICCERGFDDPREGAVLELLPVGDGIVRLHMCCEECLND